MRKDLKDVIVNASRSKYGEKKSSSLSILREEQIEALPEKQGIRRNHTGWRFSFGDRLKPLIGFLRKNVGCSWNDVWSEICCHSDARNIRGKHLRDHVKQYVIGAGGQEGPGDRRWWRNSFYVDSDGILQEKSPISYRYVPKHDPDSCMIGDDVYERINGCWFITWYKKVQKARESFNYILRKKEIEYYYEDVLVSKKQLSRRELRQLNLSNDPDFKWWENKDERISPRESTY